MGHETPNVTSSNTAYQICYLNYLLQTNVSFPKRQPNTECKIQHSTNRIRFNQYKSDMNTVKVKEVLCERSLGYISSHMGIVAGTITSSWKYLDTLVPPK